MAALTLRAYAKVNLALEVLGRRPDGYHDVATVLQTVSLHDELTLTPAPDLVLQCDAPGLQGPDNLALRAAALLRRESGIRGGAAIHLRKSISIASGLGGGSSDAAATLRGLNRLWDLGLSRDRLSDLAACIGSDVPFFLHGGTALAEGRGERVTPLPSVGEQWMVIVGPAAQVEGKTPRLYGLLRSEHFTYGAAVASLADAMRDGAQWTDARMRNTFEAVADEVFEGLPNYREAMREAGAAHVHLSGSGPSLFTCVESESAGRALRSRLHARSITAHLVRTVTPEGA